VVFSPPPLVLFAQHGDRFSQVALGFNQRRAAVVNPAFVRSRNSFTSLAGISMLYLVYSSFFLLLSLLSLILFEILSISYKRPAANASRRSEKFSYPRVLKRDSSSAETVASAPA